MMNFKKAISRFAALMLSCLMVLSVPLTALADGDVNQNANSGGAIPSGEDAAYAHKFYAYPCNQGWRFTIVDDKGNPVSNSVDAVVYFPTHIEDIVRANKTPTISGATGSTSELLNGYQRYKHWIGWTDNSKGGLNQTKDKSLMMSNGIKTREFTGVSWNHFGVPNTVVNGRSIQNKVYPISILNEYLRDAIKYLIEKEGGTVDANKLAELSIPVPSILNGNQFSAGGTLLKEMATKAVNEFNTDSTKKLESNIIKAVLNAKAPVYNNQCQQVGSGSDFLFRYINPEDNSRIDTIGSDGEKIFVSTIFTEKQYKLAVEPIYFGIPELVAYDTGVIQKFGNFHIAWANGVWYGTVSYVNKQFYDLIKNSGRLKELGMTDEDLDKCTVFPDWGFGNMGPTTAMLSHNEESMGLYEPSQEGHNLHRLTNGFSLYSMAADDRYRTVGFALHLYTPDMLEQPSGTPTWDSSTYPSDNYKPGPAPDTSDRTKYPKETSYTPNNNNKSNIVKFYVRKQGDSEVPVSNFTRENTLHTININDEPGYKVVDYFSSTTYKKPESSSTTYESVKSTVPNGSLKGTSSGSVVLTPESNENTLYIKLISNVKVVKVYETGGNVDKVVTDTNPNITNNTLNITTPDNGYEYTENIQSPTDKTPSSWEDVPDGTPGTEVNVPLRDDTTTIYIHYHKDGSSNTGLVLHENEISHQFGLSDVKGNLLDGIRKYSSVSVSGSCDYWYDGDDDDDGYYCGAPYEYQNSDDWTYTIENVPNYNTQFVWKWVQTDQKSYSGNGLSESGGEGRSTPNMNMVLQRSISDKGTLYPNKNSDESTLKAMGLQGAAYQPVHQRKDGVSDQPSRKSWTETFTTNWTFTAHNTPTAYFATDHGYPDTDEHTNTGNESELNSAYSQTGNTLVYGLWGKANEGIASPASDKASNSKWDIEGVLKFTGLKSHFKADAKMQFYPYYRMKYVSELDSSEKDAYLTSENLSKLLNIQRVDTAMFKASSGKTLDLTSTQWSIHAGAQKLIKDSADKDSLLPAGAIYTLGSAGGGSKASPIWIGYRIFNTYVPDKAVLADATGIKNRDEVLATINQFKSETDRVVDGLEVVMYGKTGLDFSSDDTKFWQNSKQITGKDGQYGIGGQKFISDKKYDLKTGGTGTDSSDINILERKEEQYDWILSSDVDGNITISRNGQELEKLTKNNKTFTNAEVKEFNDRTKLVENFISSIDRNLGSDRTGRSWYNEGFTVGCIEERYAVRVGFGDEDHNKRSAALNIKANGKLDNRQDMFSGDPEKNRSYQFFTATRSTVADAGSHQPGWIGTYDGTDIQLPNIHLLLSSKRFYTSNTTVMDLN